MTYQSTTRLCNHLHSLSLSKRLLSTLHHKPLQTYLPLQHIQRVQHRCVNTRPVSTLSDIEKLVNSPVTFLGMEYLQNDEIFYLLENIRKIIGTKHPIVEFGAQTLLGSAGGTFKIHGLITLLVSQIINSMSGGKHTADRTGVLPKQRKLVEVCEMISTALFLHDNVISLAHVPPNSRHNMKHGNKLSLLFGDYFLSTACSQLATMEHPGVVDAVSQAIAKCVEGRFWLETIDYNNVPELSALSSYCSMKHGALLSSSCYSVALLTGHSDKSHVTLSLLKFGDHVGQALQLKKELLAAEGNSAKLEPGLSSFPFISAVINLAKSDVRNYEELDEASIRHIIECGHGVQSTHEQCSYHCDKALECIKDFDVNEPLSCNLYKVVTDIKSTSPILTV